MAASTPEDPYEVLQVQQTASPDEIKSAYRKLALRNHPDKNQGASAEEAAEKFQRIATAYGILSDPDKRRRYDQGGFANLNPSDLEVQLDLSSLGMVNTAMAAIFNKLGVPVKTVVAQHVLDAAYMGNFKALQLQFGEKHSDKVDKAGVVFYELTVTEQHIAEGFAVGAHSIQGSRFKLLLFEQAVDTQWELLTQEDSQKTKKGMQMAGLYFFPFLTCRMGPKPSALETGSDPEAMLFKRLDSMQARDHVQLRPGRILVAVYGDNWFNRVRYTIQAVHTMSTDRSLAPIADTVQQVEAKLLRKKTELRQFESEYRQVQSQFDTVVKRFNKEQKEVEDLLQIRDQAYLDLLAGNDGQAVVPRQQTSPQKGWLKGS